jgi:hypothetical protein
LSGRHDFSRLSRALIAECFNGCSAL